MKLVGQMNSLWGTASYSPHSHCCLLQASNTLLVPVCVFANVSHTALLEVKKTLYNQVHSLQYSIYLCNLKGSRRQTPSLPPWATWVLICYLDWGFHLLYAVFFGCRQSWIFSSSAIPPLILCVCVLMACLWSISEWLPCRATLQALLPQRIKPESQAHRENSSSEDRG